ncbi:hypothetical protein BH23THE1_BH23THE1_17930 [soil metagenome]
MKNLPVLDNDENNPCNFYGYDVMNLMKETSDLRDYYQKRNIRNLDASLLFHRSGKIFDF